MVTEAVEGLAAVCIAWVQILVGAL